jgi:hypothetical protein
MVVMAKMNCSEVRIMTLLKVVIKMISSSATKEQTDSKETTVTIPSLGTKIVIQSLVTPGMT